LWDSLGFERIGRVPGCGQLKGHEKLVDAIQYGRHLVSKEELGRKVDEKELGSQKTEAKEGEEKKEAAETVSGVSGETELGAGVLL
jgi:hypothetical protein